jgi:DNA-directed RNA polymerase specialized sigma subunit
MKNLVPAAIVAWDERQVGEPLRPGSGKTNLVSRAQRHLIKEGSEAAKLERKGKFADLEVAPGSKGEGREDADLAEFEHQETLRQQLQALPGWIESAKFSEQEQLVYELDKELDEDTQTIARELGISREQVRVVRKNYHDKIRRAAGL